MEEKLKEIFSNFSDVDVSSITADTVILRDLGLNSFAVVELVNEIEDEFDVEIEDSVLPQIKTVGDMLHYLEENR